MIVKSIIEDSILVHKKVTPRLLKLLESAEDNDIGSGVSNTSSHKIQTIQVLTILNQLQIIIVRP